MGGEDEDDCNFGSGDHPGTDSDHPAAGSGNHPGTLLQFGEFSVSPLEEVGDGGYLLKTGFRKAIFFLRIFYLFPFLGLSILQLRKSVTIILEVSNAEG